MTLSATYILSQLDVNLSKDTASVRLESGRSEIAMVLRATGGPNTRKTTPAGSLRELLAQQWLQQCTHLEVLLIKRVHSPRDLWSGHIAMPGGHAHPVEQAGDTSIRETWEEVGLNLSPPHAVLLGCIPNLRVRNGKLASAFGMIIIRNKGQTDFILSVYVLSTAIQPVLNICVDEVAAAHWFPLDVFLQPLTGREYFKLVGSMRGWSEALLLRTDTGMLHT